MAATVLIKTLKDNQAEVKALVGEQQNWKLAESRMDGLFKRMSDPTDKLWSDSTFQKFKTVYAKQKENDGGMSNIITRTIKGTPENLKEDFRIMFLQIAEVCTTFNAAHKVNFEAEELPKNYKHIKITPGKAKGQFTFGEPSPSIYKKTSLTFDYWVPKFIEWTEEIRTRKLKSWKGEAIMAHESCTDFMRICLMFISDSKNSPPIAKAEDRQAFLSMAGEEYTWIKKSAKREDIPANNKKLVSVLQKAAMENKMDIPLEAWSRLQNTTFLKTILK